MPQLYMLSTTFPTSGFFLRTGLVEIDGAEQPSQRFELGTLIDDKSGPAKSTRFLAVIPFKKISAGSCNL